MSRLPYCEELPADVSDLEVQAEERAIYLEHRAEYGGVPEYQAEALGQAAMPDDPASLAWQLRNLKARVIHLEKVASNHLRNQVNATVRGQQSFQSDLQRLQTDQQRLQGKSSISILLAPTY